MFYCTIAEQFANVDNAKSPNFEKVLQRGRSCAINDVRRYTGALRGIISYKAMSASNQFQCQFYQSFGFRPWYECILADIQHHGPEFPLACQVGNGFS